MFISGLPELPIYTWCVKKFKYCYYGYFMKGVIRMWKLLDSHNCYSIFMVRQDRI